MDSKQPKPLDQYFKAKDGTHQIYLFPNGRRKTGPGSDARWLCSGNNNKCTKLAWVGQFCRGCRGASKETTPPPPVVTEEMTEMQRLIALQIIEIVNNPENKADMQELVELQLMLHNKKRPAAAGLIGRLLQMRT